MLIKPIIKLTKCCATTCFRLSQFFLLQLRLLTGTFKTSMTILKSFILSLDKHPILSINHLLLPYYIDRELISTLLLLIRIKSNSIGLNQYQTQTLMAKQH